MQVLITSQSSRWLGFFVHYFFFLLLCFFSREKERLESGKGKFKKLSRLLVSYQEADPAKLEEDTPTPQHYILFVNPPDPVFVHNCHSDRFSHVTICQALFRTNIPQCPIFRFKRFSPFYSPLSQLKVKTLHPPHHVPASTCNALIKKGKSYEQVFCRGSELLG